MKHYLNITVLLLLTYLLPAQGSVDPCPAPSVTSKVVIQYEQYAKAYLEFDADNFILKVRTADHASAQSYTVANGQLVIPDMTHETVFELTAVNECGDEVVIEQVYTGPANTEQDGLSVSGRMFDAIAAWQRLDPRPRLYDYLQQNNTLPAYEKMAFVQAFYYQGKPFRTDQGDGMEEPPVLNGCNCMLILKHNQFAVPGVQQNGAIIPDLEDSNGEIDWNDQSGYFYKRSTSGAAKWHFIRTQGWKAGGTARHYGYAVADSTFSPHHGELALSYVCEDGQEPGRECECTKTVRFSSRYDTRVSAKSNLLGGISLGDRDAWALTQDVALVTLRYGESPDIQVLAAGDVAVSSACDASINTQFFVNYFTVAAQVATALLQSETTGIIDPAIIAGIANSMGVLISTPIYNTTTCSTLVDVKTLVLNNTTVELGSNQRVYYDLFSFTNQHAGGKRSWESESNINSSFYMVSTVPGGAGEQPRECCTNTLATWVYADEGGPLNDQSLAKFVGGELNLAGGGPNAHWRYLGVLDLPVDPGTGAVKIPAEYGWADILIDCEGFAPPPSDDLSAATPHPAGNASPAQPTGAGAPAANRTAPESSVAETDYTGPAMVYIFDISGRLLYSGQHDVDKSTLRAFFLERNLAHTPGIYFAHLVRGKHRETVKIAVVN